MKKFAAVLVAVALAFGLTGCGGGISQSDYDSVVSERDELIESNNNLSSSLDLAQATASDAEERLSSANKEIASLQQQLSDLQSSKEASTQGKLSEEGVLVHQDEYVEVLYLGCELDLRGDGEMVFRVTNKTDVELTFQGSTLAIDGESLGYVSGSDSVAAQSSGKIRYSTAEDFPTLSPSTITGTLSVIDFSRTLLQRSYDFSFTNLEV